MLGATVGPTQFLVSHLVRRVVLRQPSSSVVFIRRGNGGVIKVKVN